MRIGIVAISTSFAGGEKVVYHLAERLSRKKDVRVILFLNQEILKYYDISGVRKVNIGSYTHSGKLADKFKSFSNFYTLRQNLSRLVETNRIDVLNAHMELAHLLSPTRNLVIVLHGSDIRDFLRPTGLEYSVFAYPKTRRCYNNCRRIISVSSEQIEHFQQRYKRKTVVIPNGVNSKVFRPLKTVTQRRNVVLFTGRYIERKGFLELVSAAKQLPQYEFWFAGQGPLSNLLDLPNTTNLGFKTTEELVQLYNQATICVFPSHWEALPLCGLEAMACRKAIVATPIGFSEYVENGKDGIIVPCKNADALRDAIRNLMENKCMIAELGRNARKKAVDLGWENVAEQYFKVFREVDTENRTGTIS